MKALAFLLTLATLGLGSWAVYEYSRRTHLERALVAMGKERDALRRTAAMKISVNSGVEIHADGPVGLGEHAPNDDESKSATNAAKQNESPIGAMAEMMKNPAMKEALKAQIRTQLDTEYRDLFDSFHLDETTRKAAEDAIVNRNSVTADVGLEMFSVNSDKAIRQKIIARQKIVTEETGNTLKSLLGDQKFFKLEQFEASAPERTQLRTLNNQLRDDGVTPLDEATESKLMDTMYETRKAFAFTHDLSNPATPNIDRYNPEALQLHATENQRLQDVVAKKAATFLTKSQLETLKKIQQQERMLQAAGMEMLQNMNTQKTPSIGD